VQRGGGNSGGQRKKNGEKMCSRQTGESLTKDPSEPKKKKIGGNTLEKKKIGATRRKGGEVRSVLGRRAGD